MHSFCDIYLGPCKFHVVELFALSGTAGKFGRGNSLVRFPRGRRFACRERSQIVRPWRPGTRQPVRRWRASLPACFAGPGDLPEDERVKPSFSIPGGIRQENIIYIGIFRFSVVLPSYKFIRLFKPVAETCQLSLVCLSIIQSETCLAQTSLGRVLLPEDNGRSFRGATQASRWPAGLRLCRKKRAARRAGPDYLNERGLLEPPVSARTSMLPARSRPPFLHLRSRQLSVVPDSWRENYSILPAWIFSFREGRSSTGPRRRGRRAWRGSKPLALPPHEGCPTPDSSPSATPDSLQELVRSVTDLSDPCSR